MRRVYQSNPRRKKLQQEMLLNMRAARRQIDPTLLDQARDAILNAHEKKAETTSHISMDRRNTLSIVLQYMELIRHDPDRRRDLKKLLTDQI